MEIFFEYFNSAVESGGVELILTAVGLPMAAAGVGRLSKNQEGKENKRGNHWRIGKTAT
jgi:predicted phage tail protein